MTASRIQQIGPVRAAVKVEAPHDFPDGMTPQHRSPPTARDHARTPADPAALVAIGADMFRFAMLQLGDRAAAEDMVQEATEAALRHLAQFSGQASLKTWVFAILKNKIIDHLRLARRTVNFSSLANADDDNGDASLERLFNDRGGWRDGPRPVAWPSPDEAVQSREFWVVFEACLDLLPAKTGRIFMMREFLGFETTEICGQLDLTTTNLHVILHRARIKLRGCLETGWVRPGEQRC